MKNRPNIRATRLAGIAVAVAGVIAGAGGIAAVPADAAASHKAESSSYRHAHFERPELRHGTLIVKGTRASDRIALRLKAGRPDILQVDVGDDGSADFAVKRRFVARIVVDARAGNDLVRIDESNGVFTDTHPDDARWRKRKRQPRRRHRSGDAARRPTATTRSTATGAMTSRSWAPATTRSCGIRATAATSSRARPAPTRWSSTAPPRRSTSICRPTETGCGSSATPATSRWTPTASRRSTSTRSAAPTRSPSTTSPAPTSRTVNADLAGTLGGATGDGATDSVVVNGTKANDAIDVSGDATGVAVSGLTTRVAIQHQDPIDALVVNGLGGNDAISAANLAAQAIALTLDGGTGNDTIAGGHGRRDAPRRRRQRHDRRQRGQ